VRREVSAFFYHAVSDEPLDHVRHLYPVVPVAQFDAALSYLKEHFRGVTYQQLHAYRFEGAELPARALHLSFDDEFVECYTLVRPLLQKYKFPCTFFVTTDWVDNQAMFHQHKISLCVARLKTHTIDFGAFDALPNGITSQDDFTRWVRSLDHADGAMIDAVCRFLGVDWKALLREERLYMTRQQLKDLHEAGFTIGAHGKSHRKLMSLSDAEVEAEIVESCQIVRQITGQEIVPFSFPHSAFGLNRRMLADVRARHPFIGLLFDTKGLRRDADFIINRIWAEDPLGRNQGAQPIPALLQAAYRDAWLEGVLGSLRSLRG
jgi:peptidoglycan/xylan/chitin deacetylase (PgdA/CDA1 family)